MRSVYLIARNAVRESLRRRIMYLVILFIIALLVMTESVARFEAQVQMKMVKDFSYAIISFFGLVVVLISTFDQLPAEIESKTIYLPLSRPIPRQRFLLGKYLGVLFILTMFVLMMTVILFIATNWGQSLKAVSLDEQLLQAMYLMWLKYASFASLLLMLSIFVSRPLAVTLALLGFLYSHINHFLYQTLASGPAAIFTGILWVVDFVLPNYSVLDLPSGILYADILSMSSLAVLTAYAASFACLYLLIAIWAFGTKEL